MGGGLRMASQSAGNVLFLDVDAGFLNVSTSLKFLRL